MALRSDRLLALRTKHVKGLSGGSRDKFLVFQILRLDTELHYVFVISAREVSTSKNNSKMVRKRQSALLAVQLSLI